MVVAQRTFRKADVREKISLLKDLKMSIEGTFQGKFETKIKGKDTICMKFDLADGRKVSFPANHGLISILEEAGVKEGDYIRATSTGKKTLDGGKTVNQYDLEIAN